MPKILNYPLASFQKSIEVAEAADSLGGTCNIETCAQKLEKKVSGGFMMIISSAQKYGLIEATKGTITVTEEFKLIKHSYSEEEKIALLRKAFLSPQVFSLLYERFAGRELPVKLLDKILVREFGVEEAASGRVAGYFIDGLKEFGLLDTNNLVQGKPENKEVKPENIEITKTEQLKQVEKTIQQTEVDSATGFIVHIYGPGLNNKIKIDEEEDLLIVEATLKKAKKALKGAENQS